MSIQAITVILIGLISFTLSCKSRDASKIKLINAVETSGFPATAALRSKKTLCTATFIDRVAFLTAAHCFENKNQDYYIESKGKKNKVAHYIQHPKYNPKLTSHNLNPYDIAIGFTEDAHPAYALRCQIDKDTPEELILVGYGSNDYLVKNPDGSTIPSDGKKRSGVNKDIERVSDNRGLKITSKSDKGTNLRPGDSGGSLYEKDRTVQFGLKGHCLRAVAQKIHTPGPQSYSTTTDGFAIDLANDATSRFISANKPRLIEIKSYDKKDKLMDHWYIHPDQPTWWHQEHKYGRRMQKNFHSIGINYLPRGSMLIIYDNKSTHVHKKSGREKKYDSDYLILIGQGYDREVKMNHLSRIPNRRHGDRAKGFYRWRNGLSGQVSQMWYTPNCRQFVLKYVRADNPKYHGNLTDKEIKTLCKTP